jgi:hypothetical protein
MMSELVASGPLTAHTACHVLAIAVLGTAIFLDSVWLARAGSAVGLAGAVAFAWFAGGVLRHLMRRA